MSFISLASRSSTYMVTPVFLPKTPASNTGLIPHLEFKSSVDTLTIVLRKVSSAASAVEIKELIEKSFGECIDFDTHRPTFMMKQWSGSSRASVRGTQLHWQAPTDEAAGELRIHLPGRAIAASTQEDFRDCIQVLWSLYGGECTRIDVAVDDGLKMTDMSALHEAQRNRNYTGVRSHRRVSSGGLQEADGVTYYFGSSSSDMQLRVYDKAIESKGKVDVIRWELQFRRAKAHEMCNVWLATEASEGSDVGSALSGAVAGAVDFIDRSKRHKDLTRCHRLPWWSKLRSYFSKAYRLKPKPKEVLMEKKIGWLCKAVMPSLAVVQAYMGDCRFWQFIEEEIGDKKPLLSPINKSLIEQAKKADAARFKMSNAARELREDLLSFQVPIKTGLLVLD